MVRAVQSKSRIQELETPLQDFLSKEKRAYEKGIKEGPKYKVGEQVDLDMNVRFVHGDLVVADSLTDGSLLAACSIYKKWVASL
jgi:hypothetical protein